ncbi:MAG: hypothetical protein IPO79_16915 [Flavobacteriales bacterium]|nr:hypothetical protein [Flavobacteriales bacterium]
MPSVGTACDDGLATTGNDLWDANCVCAGQLIDCLGVPGGSALPGTACNDNNANTGNDTWDANCVCAGQLIDCLGVPGGSAVPGTACDDGNALTGNDVWRQLQLRRPADRLPGRAGWLRPRRHRLRRPQHRATTPGTANCVCVGQPTLTASACQGQRPAGTACDDGTATPATTCGMPTACALAS